MSNIRDEESAIESLNSSNFGEQNIPQDQISPIVSAETAFSRNSHEITKTKTETAQSLKSLGISSEIPRPDINAPPTDKPIFPEEYTLETTTGLVPVKTLASLGRAKTRASGSRALARGQPLDSTGSEEKPPVDDSGEGEGEGEPEKELDDDIEFITFKPGDKENPHNWNIYLRWLYTFILSMAVISASYGSSSLASGLPLVNKKYHVSTEVSILTVSLMVLGFLVGPLLWAPLSEQIGRRPVYFISFGLYTIFNIPVALSPNIGGCLVSRFLCGVFSASALSNVAASLVDMHNETRGFAIAFFSFCPYSGPVLGGVVNGFISVDSHRYDLMVWVNMAFAGGMWIALMIIPETYPPVILQRRAKKLRKETGNPKIMTEQEASPMTIKELIETNLYRPIKFIFQEPVLDAVCFFVALIYALLYAFFFAYPYIFGKLYNYKDDKIGLMYVPILIGACLAVVTTALLEKQYAAILRRRKPTPEDRLIGAMIGAPFPCIALFILGATSWKHIIWVGPASSGLAFGYGMVLIYYSLNNYIIDTYQKYAASALATKVFLRSAGGAAFPLFVTQMYEGMGLQWASWLLAFVSLAMILIPFSFYKFGGPMRAKLCKEDYSMDAA